METSSNHLCSDFFFKQLEKGFIYLNYQYFQISATVEDSAMELVRFLERSSPEEPVNIHEYYQEYTLDVIMRIAMGQNGSNLFKNPLGESVQKVCEK